MKRFLDLLVSLLFFIIFSPLFFIFIIVIIIDSRGNAIYRQPRVGKDNKDFMLYKFRTMKSNSDQNGLLTIGNNDPRITKFGYFLRKYKLDEFPQLINIIKGEMSIVGPRPEVRKYVNYYNKEQMKVLSVRPGLTDYASIAYINENDILALIDDPEKKYIEEIMPHKITLNMQYIENLSIKEDIRIIFITLRKIMGSRR